MSGPTVCSWIPVASAGTLSGPVNVTGQLAVSQAFLPLLRVAHERKGSSPDVLAAAVARAIRTARPRAFTGVRSSRGEYGVPAVTARAWERMSDD